MIGSLQFFFINMQMVLAFFLSANSLMFFGIKYAEIGGNPIIKIHIYTYMACVFFSILVLKYGYEGLKAVLGRYLFVWLFSLVCILWVIGLGLYKNGTSGIAYMADTIFSAIVMVPVIKSLSYQQSRVVFRVLSLLIFTNSSIAIVEFLFQSNLWPWPEGLVFEYFRSSAMLGHPLNNALITVSTVLILFQDKIIHPIIYIGVVVLSLFCFGGRGAMGLLLIATFLILFRSFMSFMVGKVGFSWKSFFTGAVLFIFGGGGLVSLLISTGMHTRIVEKMEVDNSAQVRIDVVQIIYRMDYYQWIFGAYKEMVEGVKLRYGFKIIENYLIAWVSEFGLLGALPLFLSIYLILGKLMLERNVYITASIIIFSIVALTNNSLVTKTPVVFYFFVSMFLMLNLKYNYKKNIMVN